MTPRSPELDPVLARIEADLETTLERWAALMRIPSVSTDPAYRAEMREAAEWMAGELESLGFAAEIRETDGQPVVVGRVNGPPGGPHLLYYAHYDVQPPDPLEEWSSPPFEPTLTDGPHGRRMIGRGAVDNKGQMMTFLAAFRAWRAVHGELPARVTVVVEGEEEIGSRHLPDFLERHRDELAADVCIISDTAGWDIDTPALTTMLRGLLYTEITVRGPSHDLHSGFYGGAVPNPLNALAQVLAAMHDGHGRVAVPGFYDDVREPPAKAREAWARLAIDEGAFLRAVGVEAGGAEHDRPLLERLWSRPTLDVHGLYGGYTGAGAKTVIATHGTAKVSCRLVNDQDPEGIARALARFVDGHTPAGCRAEVAVHTSAPPIRVATDSPYVRAAEAALARVYGREPLQIGCGGSIPVVAWLRELLGVETLLMGFSLEDDRMHGPDEKFEVTCLERGAKAHAALLAEVGRPGG